MKKWNPFINLNDLPFVVDHFVAPCNPFDDEILAVMIMFKVVNPSL